ncbi:Protein of unknown function [Chryseolinea serpens]|uniref:DUF2480 family protein n=1 Tax=Chryseolinea serpens TaxID=947013 RepID=A0A1M5X9E7_9BACT|nr:DUF2480 family protein [Chryseolinea serpens]SHH96396.1 Protein of unknown function [Chryseolinea serpens]
MEETQDQIVNKVANSALVTFDLEHYYQPGERVVLDIKGQLYQGLILKEKDFRDFIRQHDWAAYQDKYVAITCTADAIVPTWAYMLVSIALQPYAKQVVFGTLEELETAIFKKSLEKVDWSSFQNAKIVVKGCSKVDVPVAIYVEATNNLRPYAASIMFGEPCSTVPLYKKPKN